MPRETITLRDWPQGPWHHLDGIHRDPRIAKLESVITGVLQAQYDFLYTSGMTPQMLVPVIQGIQSYLNILEGQLRNLPAEWNYEFRWHRNHGVTLLDSWLRSREVRLELPIGRPESDPTWFPVDAFGAPVTRTQVSVQTNQNGQQTMSSAQAGHRSREQIQNHSPLPDSSQRQQPQQHQQEQEQGQRERGLLTGFMNRNFDQLGHAQRGLARRHGERLARPRGGLQGQQVGGNQLGNLTYGPGEDPLPQSSHSLTKAVQIVDSDDMPIHMFFIIDGNTHSHAAEMRRRATAAAKARRQQIGGDVIAVAEAALSSNNPKIKKVCDTARGELFVTEPGREDLAAVLNEIANLGNEVKREEAVWRLCGVGTTISEGRLYMLRNASK
jgi:hypothetical protein